MLELLLAGEPVDLPEDAAVALSYQVADMNDLQSRGGSYSETFSLPYTHRNARVLQTAHSLDGGDAPYKRVPFELLQSGLMILSGTALLDKSDEDGYQVLLMSDTGALFAAVGNRKLQELDLSEFDHRLTNNNVQAAQVLIGPYTYPLVNDGRLTKRYAASTAAVHYSELAPAVYSHVLLSRIVSAALPGFTLSGSLLKDTRFLRHQLYQAKGAQRRPQYLEQHTASAATETVQQVANTAQTLAFTDTLADPGGHLTTSSDGTTYDTPNEVADYEVKLEAEVTFTGSGGPYSGTQRVSIILAENNLAFYQEVLYEGNWEDGIVPQTRRVKLQHTFRRVAPNGPILAQLVAENQMQMSVAVGAVLTVTPLARAYDNSPVHLDAGLPDWQQSDFLLLLAAQFGAVFQADTITKSIRIDTLADLAKRTPLDWTDKLDYTVRPRLTYRLNNTANRNILQYAEAPAGYEVFLGEPDRGEGELLCELDQTLPAEREAYAAPVPVLRTDMSFQRLTVLPFTPRFTQTDQQLIELWRPGITYPTDYYVLDQGRYWRARKLIDATFPRPGTDSEFWQLVEESAIFSGDEATDYCALATVLQSLPGMRVGESGGGTSWMPAATLSFDGLDFGADLIPAYYEPLQQLLSRVRLVEAEVRLSAVDIATLDFTKPIRLNVQHWPGYGPLQGDFYLNLIDQYQPGSTGPVRCEFVALNGPVVSQFSLDGRNRIFDYTFDPTFN